MLGIFNETVHIAVNSDSFVEGNEVLYIQLVLNSDNSQVEIVNDTITLVIYDDDGKLSMCSTRIASPVGIGYVCHVHHREGWHSIVLRPYSQLFNAACAYVKRLGDLGTRLG